MIDETLLDSPEELARADLRGMLRSVATSGAQVRTALRGAAESELTRLNPEGRPGTVLLAGPGPDVPLAAGLLEALGDGAVRVTRLAPTGPLAAPGALRWPLPRWAGPMDLLVVTSRDGSEPGLTDLLERAYRRGLAVASVAPAGSSLAELTLRRRSLSMELTSAPHTEEAAHPAAPGPQWSLVTPVLLLGDRLGVCSADGGQLAALADRLDHTAELCGPVSRTHANPAKSLAGALDEALPLLWSEGALAGAAARHAAGTLTTLPGAPALAAELPEALHTHAALLNGGLAGGTAADPDDFFRDRVEDPPALRVQVVLVHSTPAERQPDQGPGPGAPDAAGAGAGAGPSVPSAAAAARDLAAEQGAALSEVAAAEGSGPLETAGELIARLDFAAVYLALTGSARS